MSVLISTVDAESPKRAFVTKVNHFVSRINDTF